MKSLGKSAIPRQMLAELEKVGEDIRYARIRRKFTMEELSKRACISRQTLNKVEKGSPNVAIGIYARVLFLLGITGTVRNLADLSNDPISRDIEIASLPQRVKKKVYSSNRCHDQW